MSTDAQFDPPRPWRGGPQKQHPMGERDEPADEPTAAERAQHADQSDRPAEQRPSERPKAEPEG